MNLPKFLQTRSLLTSKDTWHQGTLQDSTEGQIWLPLPRTASVSRQCEVLHILYFLWTKSNIRNALNMLLQAKCHALYMSLLSLLFKFRNQLLVSFLLIEGTATVMFLSQLKWVYQPKKDSSGTTNILQLQVNLQPRDQTRDALS